MPADGQDVTQAASGLTRMGGALQDGGSCGRGLSK